MQIFFWFLADLNFHNKERICFIWRILNFIFSWVNDLEANENVCENWAVSDWLFVKFFEISEIMSKFLE